MYPLKVVWSGRLFFKASLVYLQSKPIVSFLVIFSSCKWICINPEFFANRNIPFIFYNAT